MTPALFFSIGCSSSSTPRAAICFLSVPTVIVPTNGTESISPWPAVSLVGLIAEGGQGMRTANNARFLGYLEGTSPAVDIRKRREQWTGAWLAHPRIGPAFRSALVTTGGDPTKPTADNAAWEATVEPLRRQFGDPALGFGKTDLYRIVPAALVATGDDFQFAWQQRKAALLARWQKAGEFKEFWGGTLTGGLSATTLTRLRKAKADEVTGRAFCDLCRELSRWVNVSPADQRAARRDALGLRSSEFYDDPDDCARIATIYNGLGGKGLFVPYRKGDPEGNRWLDNEPLYIDWSQTNVRFLFENSGRPESRMPVVRNAHLYFTPGVTWTLYANHVAVKARYQDPCVFDAGGSRLTPPPKFIAATVFLAIINSDVFSFFLKRFVKHNQDVEMNDMRAMPFVMPTPVQAKRLRELAERAMEAKRCEFANQAPSQALAAFCRAAKDALVAHAPAYLRPAAQEQLLATPASCLAVIERAVNWEAEKLYGVEGQGPFAEF